MTSTELQLFTFAPGLLLRSIHRDSSHWFIVKDIADALGFRDAFSAVQHLDPDETANLPLEGFSRGAIIVNESGLYSLILRSRKPEAKAFRRWVTSVVLPSLHRDGIYIAGQDTPIPEDISLADLQAQQADLARRISDKLAALAEAQTLSWAKSRGDRSDYRQAMKFLGRATGRKAPRKPRTAMQK